jgi:hypothetical protein
MDEEDMLNASRIYGLTKSDKRLYRYLADEYGRMIEGTFKYINGLVMSDFAEEVTGEKNGRRWKAWRAKGDGTFVKGSFAYVEEEVTSEELTDEIDVLSEEEEEDRYSKQYI